MKWVLLNDYGTDIHYNLTRYVYFITRQILSTNVCLNQVKIVSMIRKYHNHKLQINPWPRKEEPHNTQETRGRQKGKTTSSLFSINMIAKLEQTQSNGTNNQQRINNNRSTTLERRILTLLHYRTHTHYNRLY